MEEVRRRYYLIVNHNNKETYVLNYFNDFDFGKRNYVLSSIDNLTLNFENENEFLLFLRDYVGINNEGAKIQIKYNSNKQKRYLKPAYSDKEILKPYAENSNTLIQDYNLFMDIFTNFITNVQKQDFYLYMSNKNHFNKRLQLLIDEYIYQNKKYRREDIKKHLQNYRVIRDYLLGMIEYNEKNFINSKSFKTERKKINIDNHKINLKTSDEFLNSLKTREEILKHYTLQELENHGVADIFDGLNDNNYLKNKNR